MSVVAAVDCGTNSTRLLITDGTRQIERRMVITRLGQGVDKAGKLDPAAIARTVDVLAEYRTLIDAHGAIKVRAAATSAARDAVNRDEFFGAAQQALGVVPELLSGDEEGRLSFTGATVGLDPHDGPFLVVDIGGGSTELILGGAEVEGGRSLNIGSVRLTEQWLHGDPPAAEELSNAVGSVRDDLEELRAQMPMLDGGRRLVGVAGTITTVAAIEQGLAVYDRDRIHHFVLTKAAAEDVFRTLATEKLADRIHNPGLARERADVIVGGCIILVGVMRVFGFQECLVSESDILDGLADVAALETQRRPAVDEDRLAGDVARRGRAHEGDPRGRSPRRRRGPADGVAGRMTAGAVMSYRQSRGQPQTADIDRDLLEQLRQDPAPQVAPPPPPQRTAQRARTQTAARHPGPLDQLGRWLDSLVR